VRTDEVVAVAEAIELTLAMVEGGEVEVAQDFELKRAMEAFVLALGLRMIRTAMSDSDAEPDEPQAKRGEGMVRSGEKPRLALRVPSRRARRRRP
jgi:hypothetical protein